MPPPTTATEPNTQSSTPIQNSSSPSVPLNNSAISQSQSSKAKSSTTFHLLAGLASGFTSSILLQPADLLKTRVQQSGSSSLLGALRSIARSPQPVRQLWRGTTPSVIRTSFGSALYFTTLNALRTSFAKTQSFVVQDSAGTKKDATSLKNTSASSSALPQLTPLANLSCGAIARASVGFVMMPITVIKVRYESNYYNYRSLLGATRDIASAEGLRGFFSGFGATAIRDAPYAGLYVLFYEQGKRVLSGLVGGTSQAPADDMLAAPRKLTPTLSAAVNFASSAFAAATSTFLTNPPDAVKTRLQLHPAKYRNTMRAVKIMLREEGVRSLFDGLAIRMARKAASSALAWTVYEEAVRRAEAAWVR